MKDLEFLYNFKKIFFYKSFATEQKKKFPLGSLGLWCILIVNKVRNMAFLRGPGDKASLLGIWQCHGVQG